MKLQKEEIKPPDVGNCELANGIIGKTDLVEMVNSCHSQGSGRGLLPTHAASLFRNHLFHKRSSKSASLPFHKPALPLPFRLAPVKKSARSTGSTGKAQS